MTRPLPRIRDFLDRQQVIDMLGYEGEYNIQDGEVFCYQATRTLVWKAKFHMFNDRAIGVALILQPQKRKGLIT